MGQYLVPNAYAQKPHLNPCNNEYASGLAAYQSFALYLECVSTLRARSEGSGSPEPTLLSYAIDSYVEPQISHFANFTL